MQHPTIVVHGGAGAYSLVGLTGITEQAIEDGVQAAARAGYSLLTNGGSAIDAVQAAVVSMEDNPIFNAGLGSYFTVDRTIEMDACIMDGADLRTGAVCSVTNITNPIKVARLVMDKTNHTLFAGEGAKSLAKDHGFEFVSTENLMTPKALERFETNRTFVALAPALPIPVDKMTKYPDEHDTVGAVAIDCRGNLAVANSTGGVTGKMSGRVGDSAIVGAGAYADNLSGAVCTTGDGEAMVRVCTCKHAAMLMEQGTSPQRAIENALELTSRRGRGGGGSIALNCRGDIGVHFNTGGMAWVSIQDNIVESGMYQGEKRQVKLC